MDRSAADASSQGPDAGTADALTVLRRAPLRPRGFLANASNHTLLVEVDGGPLHAVYKPRAGERPLWDFPPGTLANREAAAFLVSEALGWDLVPPTVLREGPMGVGSVQRFEPHDPRRHYFVLLDEPEHRATLARIALFDLVVNNADRKGSHVLAADGGRLWAIDHGVTFHVEPKLRTVVWDLAGQHVDAQEREDLARLADALADSGAGVTLDLLGLLSAPEVTALRRRAARLAELEVLPQVPDHGNPFPWPPL